MKICPYLRSQCELLPAQWQLRHSYSWRFSVEPRFGIALGCRMRKAILSAIGAVAMSIAASGQLHAADMPMKAPPAPVAPTDSWTGFYLGGNFGGAWGDPTVSFAANDPLASTLGPGGPIKFDPTGSLGGFQAGINWQFNQSWVFGFETDFDFQPSPAKAPRHQHLREASLEAYSSRPPTKKCNGSAPCAAASAIS
jgi:hypothetical protein